MAGEGGGVATELEDLSSVPGTRVRAGFCKSPCDLHMSAMARLHPLPCALPRMCMHTSTNKCRKIEKIKEFLYLG